MAVAESKKKKKKKQWAPEIHCSSSSRKQTTFRQTVRELHCTAKQEQATSTALEKLLEDRARYLHLFIAAFKKKERLMIGEIKLAKTRAHLSHFRPTRASATIKMVTHRSDSDHTHIYQFICCDSFFLFCCSAPS